MSARTSKVLLITGAVVLFVLLFIAPKLKPASESEDAEQKQVTGKVNTSATLDVFFTTALKNLSPEKKTQFDRLQAQKKNDSLIAFWDQNKRPDLAAYITEEVAKNVASAEAWFKAGNRYYYAVPFMQDQSEVPVLYQSALRCFNKGLTLDPKNTDARIMLASCYVEGTADPMQGVSLLKSIEKTDSNNVKLQLTFAFFSVKSGQLEKAIVRFKKVLAIDPNYIEAYLHLADAYEQQGNPTETINMLEAYCEKTPDVTAKLEINKYIQQLKQNNN